MENLIKNVKDFTVFNYDGISALNLNPQGNLNLNPQTFKVDLK